LIDTARIIVRDITGRYCWDYKCSYRVEDMMFKNEKKLVSNTHMDELEEEAQTEDTDTPDSPSIKRDSLDEISDTDRSSLEIKPQNTFENVKNMGYPKFAVEINTDKADLLSHLFK
jgi:hypothetical protein